jgi:hypothetical protein
MVGEGKQKASTVQEGWLCRIWDMLLVKEQAALAGIVWNVWLEPAIRGNVNLQISLLSPLTRQEDRNR